MPDLPHMPLLDGALARKSPSDNLAKVEAMAADLIHYDAVDPERAAIRTLSCRGYAMGEIVSLLDMARAKAKQIKAQHLARGAR
jgi:hypothetical protein